MKNGTGLVQEQKCGSQIRRMCINWKLVSNANSQAPQAGGCRLEPAISFNNPWKRFWYLPKCENHRARESLFFFPLKFFSSSLRNTQSFHHNELLRIHFVIHLLPTRLFKLRVSMHWVWWIKSYNNKSHNKYINKLPRTPLANLKIGMWLLSIQKTLNSCVGFSSCMLTCFTQLFLIQDLKEKPKNPERQIRWQDKL